jgi:phage head maturation protease
MQPSHDNARPYGIDFLQQELLEFSIVSVPANAEALIRPKHVARARQAHHERECRRRTLKLAQMRASQ